MNLSTAVKMSCLLFSEKFRVWSENGKTISLSLSLSLFSVSDYMCTLMCKYFIYVFNTIRYTHIYFI